MDFSEARGHAETKLAEVEQPHLSLVLDESHIQERQWCWVFPFNSQDYCETGSINDMVLSGPIVVNKDGSEVWVTGTYKPPEEFLDDYAARHGYEPNDQPSS